ncbi:Hypothetical protein ORPV_543 [Orpheovirus IHUMI-LCC2]|uniref:Uncharacterized protein n=1 Tax=Orpheovirus IHUMI-LCC2 TaxID=2023057 RepID=A0A2I2L4J3_9VIRU|nr:Hypothetical protein ORPV_543 [Orpheovirus IHUMI-LCC2]SNW62447.1 Hypothetical protein ORPV_543 [Orpheovirus IHUMI-LCC2]
MGNSNIKRTTNINVDEHISEEEITSSIKYIFLTINLQKHLKLGYPKIIYLHVNKEKIYIDDVNKWLDKKENKFIWIPKSHMRYDDIIKIEQSGKIEERKIKKGDGIGIIILKNFNKYIKLYYEKGSKMGINYCIKNWHSTSQHKNSLGEDLSLGYDILIIKDNNVTNLCEALDHRDKRNSTFFPKYIRNNN